MDQVKCGPNNLSRLVRNSAPVLCRARGLAMTTHSNVGLRPSLCSLKYSRTIRLIRLRMTALPTLRLTVSPNRGSFVPSSLRAKSRKWGETVFAPFAVTRRKSAETRSRAALPNRPPSLLPAPTPWAGETSTEPGVATQGYTRLNQAQRVFRPRARRRERTLRPARVAMRARKPWLRLRRILLG